MPMARRDGVRFLESMPRLLLALGLASALAPTRARSTEVDAWGQERQECLRLRLDAEYSAAFECVQKLWRDHREELSREGKVDVLRLMAELYMIDDNPAEAKRCYEAVLSVDPHWLPDDFDKMPASWRAPIIEAYEARGYLMQSPGLRNIALLDFEIVDLMPSEVDLSGLAEALPTYVSAYLQEFLDGARFKGDETPIKIVSYRQRGMLMKEIALSQNVEGDVLHAGVLDPSQLVRAGQLQAVQGFLSGAIIRSLDGRVQIVVRLISVETGEVLCPQTVEGKDEDLFVLLQKSLRQWVECAVEGADLPAGRGPQQLGSMAQGVLALQRYHEALQLAEDERFAEALEMARAALDLRPGSEDIAQLVLHLGAQQALAGLAAGAPDQQLPAAVLE